jgi:hypothetical protein
MCLSTDRVSIPGELKFYHHMSMFCAASINVIMLLSAVVRPLLMAAGAGAALYLTFLGLLTISALQDHAIYLHGVKLTWGKDVNVPEQWGFLRNQVTPFYLKTSDGATLHAWHILPLETYRQKPGSAKSRARWTMSQCQREICLQVAER